MLKVLSVLFPRFHSCRPPPHILFFPSSISPNPPSSPNTAQLCVEASAAGSTLSCKGGKLNLLLLVQSVSAIFRVLVPSIASSVNTLGSSNDSQVANTTLTDVSSIATTLTSAVSGITNAASNGSVGDTAGAVVSGVADTVSAVASAFGRRLLRDGGSASSLAGRQLLQSTVRLR